MDGEQAKQLARRVQPAAERYLEQQVDEPLKVVLGSLQRIADALPEGMADYKSSSQHSLNDLILDLSLSANVIPDDIARSISEGGRATLVPDGTRQVLANAQQQLESFTAYGRDDGHPIRAMARVGQQGMNRLEQVLSEDALAENVLYPEADRR